MTIKGFVLGLGLGMAGGAAAAAILPKQPAVRQAVTKAADTVETAVQSARDAIIGSN